MPQFETTYLISQVFWMLVSFGLLYWGIHFLVFPLFNRIFELRQKKVDTVLKQAEVLTQKFQIQEEKSSLKRYQQEEHAQQRIIKAQQKAHQDLETTLQHNEKLLMNTLQRQIQKMESEEKAILTKKLNFVTKAVKGNL